MGIGLRVPLISTSVLVVSRLNIAFTRLKDPDGAGPITEGYDPDLREPYPYEDSGDLTPQGEARRKLTTQYRPQIRIPCQVEVRDSDEVRQKFGGDAPVTDITFVLHNKDLKRLGYWDYNTICPTGMHPDMIKTNDRIDRVEVKGKPNVISFPLKEKLYVYQVEPASQGMGPAGFDLHIIWTTNRPSTPMGA